MNVIVAGKQPAQWLDIDAATRHCTAGLGIWEWASNDEGGALDVVMACAGDVQQLLRDRLLEHRADITRHGRDMPEIENWRWRG